MIQIRLINLLEKWRLLLNHCRWFCWIKTPRRNSFRPWIRNFNNNKLREWTSKLLLIVEVNLRYQILHSWSVTIANVLQVKLITARNVQWNFLSCCLLGQKIFENRNCRNIVRSENCPAFAEIWKYI